MLGLLEEKDTGIKYQTSKLITALLNYKPLEIQAAVLSGVVIPSIVGLLEGPDIVRNGLSNFFN